LSLPLLFPRGGSKGIRGPNDAGCSDLGKDTFLLGGSGGGGGGGTTDSWMGVAGSKFIGVVHCMAHIGKFGHGSTRGNDTRIECTTHMATQ